MKIKVVYRGNIVRDGTTPRIKDGEFVTVASGLEGDVYTMIVNECDGLDVAKFTMSGMKKAVDKFLAFATNRPELTFTVPRLKHELYADKEIAALFHNAPKNVELPKQWK